MLGNAIAWLERQRHTFLTTEVTYSRGEGSVTLLATVGKTLFKGEDQYGRLVYYTSRDYLVRSTDLVIGESQVIPEVGDHITDGACTYEVLAPNGEPHWRWSDVNQGTMRIHTKEV